MLHLWFFFFFFFNDTATTEIYTLSLHDALPIFHGFESPKRLTSVKLFRATLIWIQQCAPHRHLWKRSEEHTSELQSQSNLVCRLLLEKKKTTIHPTYQFCDSF